MKYIQKKRPAANGAGNCIGFNHNPLIEDLQAVLRCAGLPIRDPVMVDGKLHRFHVVGDHPKSLNGWYVFYNDGNVAGAFGCWKRGISLTWCAKTGTEMTDDERIAFRQRMEEARNAREVEETIRRKDAATRASGIWKSAPLATNNHPYLIRKSVGNHGLRLHKESLVVPLRSSDGVLCSLRFIDADGKKRFLSGGRMTGCYFPIGAPMGTLCICEGYATGASLHEASGYGVAVAFSCNNLLPVALTLRAKFPRTKIILCADNDTKTVGNPGLTHAREAAVAIGGFLAVPPCHGDFNDLHRGEKS